MDTTTHVKASISRGRIIANICPAKSELRDIINIIQLKHEQLDTSFYAENLVIERVQKVHVKAGGY